MSDDLRFVHISDTHIVPDQGLYYGYNPYQALEQLVGYINNGLPFMLDFVLHTGDVTYDPDPAACQQAAAVLNELNYPTYYVRGNHDDPAAMRKYLPNLPAGSGRIDYTFAMKGFQFIILDSFGKVQPMGYLEPGQLAWLRTMCEESTAQSLVIVLHHLPVLTGNTWLDHDMYIENHEALFDTLEPFAARIRGLFFGHIHVPSSTMQRGILCSSAPAAFSQFVLPDTAPTPPLITEPGGYSLVRMTHEQTWISHHENVIPRSPRHGD